MRNLSLQVRPQAGLLLRLSAVLSRHGLRIDRQEMSAPGEDGVAELLLGVQSEHPLGPAAQTEMLAVEGVLRVSEVGGQSLDAHALQQLLHRTYPGLEQAFPAVSAVVREFAPDLDPEQRGRALHALGRQLGRRRYRSHFAEGSPLPLALALQRIVIPALRAVAPVESQGDSVVSFPSCPLCDPRPGSPSSCSFFAGMIQGLLEDAPATRGAVVVVQSCRAGGQNSAACECVVRPATP
jgi:hypothetical protein